MVSLFDPRLVELYSQHTLESHDLSTIYDLAANDSNNDVESWSFEQLLGFTVHLLLTTQSSAVQEQLSQLIPKLGSVAVLPLLKILDRIEPHNPLYSVAWQSLNQIELYPLAIGLDQTITLDTAELSALAIQVLAPLTQVDEPSVLLLLHQLISPKTWQLLQLNSLEESSSLIADIVQCDRSLKVSVISHRDHQPSVLTETPDYPRLEII
ncbi:MAG: hypothetical protein ACFB2W_10975 [Leptolyngbyaceae cyanobacterium]